MQSFKDWATAASAASVGVLTTSLDTLDAAVVKTNTAATLNGLTVTGGDSGASVHIGMNAETQDPEVVCAAGGSNTTIGPSGITQTDGSNATRTVSFHAADNPPVYEGDELHIWNAEKNNGEGRYLDHHGNFNAHESRGDCSTGENGKLPTITFTLHKNRV